MKLFLKIVLLCSIAANCAGAAELAVLRNGFSIRHEAREQMGEKTRLYLNQARSNYIDVRTDQVERIEEAPAETPSPGQAAGAPDIQQAVRAAGDKHRLDPALIASVIRAESNFNPRAVSSKGAQGLMQLMPGTASRLGVADVFDPNANVDGGSRYLSDLLDRYQGDLKKALAAYNAGPQRVEQYHGVPPYRETRAYVGSVIREFNRKKEAQQKLHGSGTAKPKPVARNIPAGATKRDAPRKKCIAASGCPKFAPAVLGANLGVRNSHPRP